MVERLERSLQLPASAAPECSQQPLEESTSRPSSKRTVDEAEVLHSKNEHRAWVFGPTALMSAVLFTGLSKIHSWQGAAGSGAAVLAAYYVSGADILWQPISALTEFSSPHTRCMDCCLRKAQSPATIPPVVSGYVKSYCSPLQTF